MSHWTDIYEGKGEIAPTFEIRDIPNGNGEDTKAILIKGGVITDQALKEKRDALSTNLRGFVYKRFDREIEEKYGQYPPKFLFGFDEENIYFCDDRSVKEPRNITAIPVEEVKDFQSIKEIFDNPNENDTQKLQEFLFTFEKNLEI